MCKKAGSYYAARVNRIAGALGVSSRLAHGEDRVGIEIGQ
jgi:hypothetical protein